MKSQFSIAACRATVLAALVAVAAAPSALAAPTTTDGTATEPAVIENIEHVGDREWLVEAYSPSMDTVIPLEVLRPADDTEPAPTLYLLNGAGGGLDRATWRQQTDIVDFFADKNINVVTPIGGAHSYYTDWVADDPEKGRNRWTTFLTEELPDALDDALGATGLNAIAGLSMSGSSVLSLAQHAPDTYEAVASYSGCAATSSEPGSRYVRTVVSLGGGDAENMWGPEGSEEWLANDALLNADKLAGTAVYVSSGGGLPTLDELALSPADAVFLGVIEAAVIGCTEQLGQRLDELGIDATVRLTPTGIHSWEYWYDALLDSWPMIAEAVDHQP